MAGYTRQSTFADGDTITAALFNNEYNQLLNAFNSLTGHKHDGTTGEGAVIALIGDTGVATPLNKVLIDTTNDHIEFWIDVSSTSVQQLYIADGAIIPVTDSDIDLGTTSLRFKDTYTDTITTTGNVSIGGDLTVTGSATISGNLTFGDADTDSINLAAEIDSDIIPNTDGTYDLGSATKEWQDLYIDGTANIDSLVADTADINGGTIDGATIATSDITVGAGKTLDVSSGTLTLADDQISGDKVEGGTIAATTITSLTATSADINGGTIDGVTIGGTTAGAVTFTDLSDGTITIAGFADEDNMSSNSATLLPTQQSVKAYVDSQVTAQDLDFQGDTGGALSIDLDSESLTIAGGTGLDTVGSGNTVTVNIDSTVATLTGTQTLTNKTLTSATLTSPVINTGVSGTAFLDDDTFATATASTLASSESIKAYVDTTVAATNEVVEDTTPQLGGDLDLNSSDITGTGNINITGTIQSSGNITGTLATAAQPNITSVGTLTGLTTSGDINFGDNDKAVFGAGSDLQIYHDSATGQSIISESGAGSFIIKGTNLFLQSADGEYMFRGNANGASSLYYDGSTKLATTSTGIDVTGTATMDGLTVDGNATFIGSASDTLATGVYTYLRGDNAGASGEGWIHQVGANYDLDVWGYSSGWKRRQRIGSNGDISFYDDTGTSQALFWDASAEALGIGTTSPNYVLNTNYNANATFSNAASDFTQMWQNSGTNALGVALADDSTARFVTNNGYEIAFNNASTEAMRIDSSGNVGIGRTSASARLHVQGPSDTATISTSSTPAARINNGGAISLWIGSNAYNYGYVQSIQDDGTNNFKPLSLQPLGANVGIGTTNPSAKLDVNGDYQGAGNIITSSGFIRSPDGSASTPSIQPGVDADTGFFRPTTNNIGFSTGGSEAMRIDSSGNVGIGTSSPTDALVVEGNVASPQRIKVSNTNASGKTTLAFTQGTTVKSWIEFDNSTSLFDVWQYTNNDLRFGTNNTERMRIDSSGNVGINTSSPSTYNAQLASFKDGGSFAYLGHNNTGGTFPKISALSFGSNAVSHTHTTNGGTVALTGSAQIAAIQSASSNAVTDMAFYTTSGGSVAEKMRIDSSGNVGIGTDSPTETLELGDGSSTNRIKIDSATKAHYIGYDGSDDALQIAAQSFLKFQTGGSFAEAMRIDSSGNVGIGTTSINNPFSFNTATQIGDVTEGTSLLTLAGTTQGSIFFADSASGTGAYTGYIEYQHGGNYMSFGTGGGTERMRIDSSGNVLIGTTSSSGSSVKLEAHDATNPIIQVKDTTSNIICGIQAGNSEAVIRCPQDSPLVFNIGASETERMRIGSDGTLQTRSSDGLAPSIGSGCVSIAGRSGSSTAGILRLIKTGDDGQIVDFFRTGNTAVGNISVTPTATSYNTSSDYRLKENVDYEFNALDRVAQLKPARFNFIADADTTVDGFLAHEVQDIVPEAITGEKDAVREEEYEVTPAVLDDDGNVVTEAEMGIREVPDYQGIDQSKLVPLLTKAIQEQQTIIDDLTTRIEALEG